MTSRRSTPHLQSIPLEAAETRPSFVMTMTVGQWNPILAAAYDLGWVLVEVDEDNRPVRAYQKAEVAS